ncbi:MAG: NAD-dependent epimerase/dehydratase family protein [Crocosphaera sp.]|nr:NAD-dependent epimerase/dehydratase family protein [Crocosphaera sp.]
MTNHPTTVALLGAGYISDYHFQALRSLPNLEIKAICDLNQVLAGQFAQARGIPKVYGDLPKMLEEEQLDVVHVLTPPHIHHATASQVVKAGVNAFIEKPLCHTVSHCQSLRQLAESSGQVIGVSHNFLYFPIYEKLLTDWRSGELGQIDSVDIVWNKALGQLQGNNFNMWLFQDPKHILFEVCPHSFAHVIHLLGQPDDLSVQVRDQVSLPEGKEFYRCWEINGSKGKTNIRIRFSFIDSYPEHYIHVRGSNGIARVDFENNTYTYQQHTPYLLDIDRYLNIARMAKDSWLQANGTLTNFVLSKMGRSQNAGPFPYSILRTVQSFYETRHNQLDERLTPAIGEAAVALAEWVAQEANLPEPSVTPQVTPEAIPLSSTPKTVLVLGGTGFIGQALVRRLCQEGYGVRILSRNPSGCPQDIRQMGVELIKGDFTNLDIVEEALEGIEWVYHLAKGDGKSWSEYLKSDVEPTEKLAQLCLEKGIKRLIYTSSIAIYYAGQNAPTITEETPPHPAMIQGSFYARSKVENERLLLALHHNQGLPVVIFRPGVVLGRGANPYHWGIAAWPYNSVCYPWGDGTNPLPIVLVDDVADAMVKAMKIPNIDGQSYNLASSPCITANDYLDEFEQESGLKFRRVRIPNWRYYLEAVLKWGIKRVGGDTDAAFPRYAELDGRSLAAMFDCSKAKRELDWSPVEDRTILLDKCVRLPVSEFFK